MPLPSRFFPMVSISSINTIQGAFSFACLKRSRTFAAPMPTNISTNSEPEMEKKGTSASPATACASSVFPVPGGPTSNAPFGMDAPISVYFWGLCRKSTISRNASFASSCPATSLKVLPVCAFTYTFAFDFPKDIALPMPPILLMAFFITNCHSRKNTTNITSVLNQGETSLGFTSPKDAPALYSRSTSCGSSILTVEYTFWVFSEKIVVPALSDLSSSFR